MTTPTLTTLRARIDSLASDGGAFVVVCGRTGDRPVPIAGRRFESRGCASRAASIAERYRVSLRRYDPALPYYDLIVVETGPVPCGKRESSSSTSMMWPPQQHSSRDETSAQTQPREPYD